MSGNTRTIGQTTTSKSFGAVAVLDADTGLPVSPSGTTTNPSVVVGNIAAGATDSGAPVKVGAVQQSTLPTLTNAQRGDLQVDVNGRLLVHLGGVNVSVGDANLNQMTVPTVSTVSTGGNGRQLGVYPFRFNGSTWDRNYCPTSASRIPSSANNTNATAAKASAGRIHSITGYNSSATTTYLKIYNKATAPTVGTDTPVMTLALPPTAAFSFTYDSMYFSTGIAYGLTTDAADAGTTVVAAGAILGLNVVYS